MKNGKNGRPPESGLGLNVIEATRFSREEFDKITSLARELRMPRAEVIRRSVAFGINRLRRVMRQT